MTTGPGPVLVVNAGSSSIKLAVYDAALGLRLSAMAEGIGTGNDQLRIGEMSQVARFENHADALRALLQGLETQGFAISHFSATAHRVVHGGASLIAPQRIDDATVAEIERCSDLAPLHNPPNLAAIKALRALLPGVAHFASFDTAFHATNPETATAYALPPEITARGIRRYGFHGISYAALIRALPRLSNAPLPPRLLAFHLGNGASICAIHAGRSIATTMGYSPLDGLTMGTRTGGIDGNAVLRLAETDGIPATRRLLNHRSGLLGLSGQAADMRQLLASDGPEANFAIDHFCYWALRHAGSLIAALRGLDAIAFTGGIGENAPEIRARLMRGLGWMGLDWSPAANQAATPCLHAKGSSITAWIVPAEEERMIAADAQALLTAAK